MSLSFFFSLFCRLFVVKLLMNKNLKLCTCFVSFQSLWLYFCIYPIGNIFFSKTKGGLKIGDYFDECMQVLISCHIAYYSLCGPRNVPYNHQ